MPGLPRHSRLEDRVSRALPGAEAGWPEARVHRVRAEGLQVRRARFPDDARHRRGPLGSRHASGRQVLRRRSGHHGLRSPRTRRGARRGEEVSGRMTKRIVALAFLALAFPAAGASGDPEVGRKLSAPCAACHGANGVSVSPEFPNLAGQYPDYLETALKHYKNGKRKNPIMAGPVVEPPPKPQAGLPGSSSPPPTPALT